jgi:hypothetical protein
MIKEIIHAILNPREGCKRMTTVTFMEALKLMEAGHAVKRDLWTLMEGYRIILPGSKNIFMVVNAHSAPQVQWAPLSIADFNATDWRVVETEDLVPPTEVDAAVEKPV